jgi:hypothetical protein
MVAHAVTQRKNGRDGSRAADSNAIGYNRRGL